MTDNHITSVLKSAPRVDCPHCLVDMTLRHLEPKEDVKEFTGSYRCPKCGIETQREFTAPAA
jgi:predicted RNA-binding Zn-ribbon protein involved in translation (DUF1610 family)